MESNKVFNKEKILKVLRKNKNIILTGAPGTGKTHLAKELAADLIGVPYEELDDNKCYWRFVQFHPSYDYTDFIEGLRPFVDEKGNMTFIRVDGIFKTFCWEALLQFSPVLTREEIEYILKHIAKNKIYIKLANGTELYITEITNSEVVLYGDYDISIKIEEIFKVVQEDKRETELNGGIVKKILGEAYDLKRYPALASLIMKIYEVADSLLDNKNPHVFIIDEINRGDISKIFGELFFSIDSGYRGEKGKVKTQYQNMVTDEDTFPDGFYVPENIYIIGTMNDIDRSVESLDFALRRRFAFYPVKAIDRSDEILSKLNDKELAEKAKDVMKAINEKIKEIGVLGSSYEIGPCYFKKLENCEGEAEERFRELWDYYLAPLVSEYLRGLDDREDFYNEIREVYNGKAGIKSAL